MKIQKQELLNKLEKAKPGLSTNEVIQGSDSFLFTGNEILTFNDEVCNRVQFKSDFKGSIKAEPFFQIIQKVKPDKEGNITLSLKGDSLYIQTQKKEKAWIGINQDGTLPIDELGEFPKEKEFKKISPDFLDGISMCSFCASTDASAPILSCASIQGKEVKSTDSYRAFTYTLKNKMDSFLIPVQNISTLKKYDIQEYCLRDSWIHFKTKENYNISIRAYPVDDFPDINKIFKVQGNAYTFPSKLTEMLDKAIIFCGGGFDIDKVVNIKIKGKKLTVSSESEVGGFNGSSVVPGDKGQELEFETNPIFLKQILSKYNECIVNEDDGRALFEGENWKYVFSIKIL